MRTDRSRFTGAAVLSALLLVTAVACTKSEPGEVAVTSISLSKASITLMMGGTEDLAVVISPDNATDNTVTWSSSDAAVATVADGRVTAVACGSAVITARCREVKAECSVIVNGFAESSLSLGMKMIYVEGGEFIMGGTSEQGSEVRVKETPIHKVSLGSYYIGECEVTQEQWKKVMGTTIYEQRDKGGYSDVYGVGADYPMYYVSWEEAMEFCRRLSEASGRKYSLPTEAQWEYAARGGKKTAGTKYSGGASVGSVAWYWGNSASEAHKVRSKLPNTLGLYDMSGNIYEWCYDWYGEYGAAAVTSPSGPSTGTYRVFRGGSWCSDAASCRVSDRTYEKPGSRCYDYGFRVAVTL